MKGLQAMNVAEVFATNVRNFRKAQGLSQEKLGEAAGLHRTYIGNIEQQAVNPSLSNVERIAEALGVPVSLLLMSPANDPRAIAAQSRAPQDASARRADSALGGGDAQQTLDNYALATFTEDGIRLQPLTVSNPSLSLQLLATLVLQGQPDELIPQLYSKMEREMVALLMRTKVDGPAGTDAPVPVAASPSTDDAGQAEGAPAAADRVTG